MAVGNLNIVLKLKDNASKELKKFGHKMRRTGRNLQATGMEMTKAITLPMAAIGAVSIREAAIVEGAMSKFNTVFAESGERMKEFVDVYRKQFPIARGQIIKLSADLQDLLVPMGISRE
ncbi:MAG TPA: hypothetical protein VKP88_07700, partial [Candidatus Paceibacterota bacterium]|nr:hypothetical protein [Candidatus Paceibacterota bacterium]